MEPRNRGRLAYAFYGRIQDFAGRTGTDIGIVLGHVMAHETGHLLLSRNAHSLVGLTRDRWGGSETELVTNGMLTFTNDEAAVIRARVAEFSVEISAQRDPK